MKSIRAFLIVLVAVATVLLVQYELVQADTDVQQKQQQQKHETLQDQVASAELKQRGARQAQAPKAGGNVITNPAEFYSDNYPIMFQLLFWTSLILGVTVLGAAYGIGYMDPGLNTVIYRMTSQRIKKDQ